MKKQKIQQRRKQLTTFTIIIFILVICFCQYNNLHNQTRLQVEAKTNLTTNLLSDASSEINTAKNFSIAWITDTQYLSENFPTYYDDMCQWIVDNKDAYNTKMVIHTGDMVNEPQNYSQWENANHSMSILLENGIPYCWNAGNHDTTEGPWIGNQFATFNSTLMQNKTYWVSDSADGKNTAVKIQANNMTFLIINIEFFADDDVINWVNSVLDQYPTAKTIIGMHAYLDGQCEYSNWAKNFQTKVLDTHSNVFLTLSGHYGSEFGNQTCQTNRYEILFNPQYSNNKTGSASIRILTFDLDRDIIEVKTFSVLRNMFLIDQNNYYSIDLKIIQSQFEINVNNLILVLIVELIVCLLILSCAKFFGRFKK